MTASNHTQNQNNHHTHHQSFFHPISFSSSEDLWQLPHSSTSPSSDWEFQYHFDEMNIMNQNDDQHLIHDTRYRDRTWSDDTLNTSSYHVEIERQGENSIIPSTTNGRSPMSVAGTTTRATPMSSRDDGRGRCPLGERTNTIRRYA